MTAQAVGQLTVPFGEAPCRCVGEHRPSVPYSHRHHIIPLSRGGSNDPANIVPLCPTGHDRVHWAMRRFDQAGAVVPLNINRYLFRLAVEGWRPLPYTMSRSSVRARSIVTSVTDRLAALSAFLTLPVPT